MKILIVEDDLTTRRLLEKFLKKNGHEVHSVEDGNEAWEYLQKNPERVIVSDWMMPGMDGLSLCRKIRENPGDEYTYFILLTSVSRNKENFRSAAEAGVDDFLSKPLNPEEIWMRLRVAERILSFTTQISELESFLPICAYCKNIRNDDNYWEQIETYINERTGTDFSHSICPKCYEKHVKPEFELLKRLKKN
ncbi:MAG: response regulator [Opitutaceae bacterium]|nr:response regulator [Opitutaceae bacterium]